MWMADSLQNENKLMKELVYTGTKEVTYREEPTPEPESGDAKIQIEAVGICGSDMHAYQGEDTR